MMQRFHQPQRPRQQTPQVEKQAQLLRCPICEGAVSDQFTPEQIEAQGYKKACRCKR